MILLKRPIPLLNKILCKLHIHKVWYIDGGKPSKYCMYCGKNVKD